MDGGEIWSYLGGVFFIIIIIIIIPVIILDMNIAGTRERSRERELGGRECGSIILLMAQ